MFLNMLLFLLVLTFDVRLLRTLLSIARLKGSLMTVCKHVRHASNHVLHIQILHLFHHHLSCFPFELVLQLIGEYVVSVEFRALNELFLLIFGFGVLCALRQ